MLFILIFYGRSATSADLLPPYYLSSNNVSGSWQFSGSSIIQEDYVILLPPIQYYKGCAWSIIPPPYRDWSIYFHLNISVETGGGGFCIWLIESHGADGPFYGGPTRFIGLGLVGVMEEPNQLKLKLIESFGKENYTKFVQNRSDFDYTYDIINESIILCIGIFTDSTNESEQYINVSFLDENFVSSDAISRRINVSLNRCWLGITASNDDKTSKIILSAARFSIFDPFIAMQHGRQKQVSIRVSSAFTSPETLPNKLRNPSFQIMNDEISSYKKNKGLITNDFESKNSDLVLSLIDECNDAFNGMAQYKNLNSFLRKTIIPYAEKWQKRTLKIISASKSSSILFSECFNKTKSLLSIFNQSIVHTTEKADKKINQLDDFLLESIVEFAADLQSINSKIVEETSIVWISVMKYISIVEVAIVTIFFCWFSNRK